MSEYKNCWHCIHKKDVGHNISGTPYYCRKDLSVSDGEDGVCQGYEADEKAIELSKNYKSREQLIDELALTKQQLAGSEAALKLALTRAQHDRKALEAAEQAIRESQEQEPVAYISKFKYDKKSKAEIITRGDRLAMSDMCASGYDFTLLYTKPVILPESAAQLHIKELREALKTCQRVDKEGCYGTATEKDYDEDKVAAALAKQPDTLALDKAMLAAEIKALDAAYKTCVPYSVEFSHMINDRKAKLAELNKV